MDFEIDEHNCLSINGIENRIHLFLSKEELMSLYITLEQYIGDEQ